VSNTIIITAEQLHAAANWTLAGPDMALVTLRDGDDGLLHLSQGDDGATFTADGTEQPESEGDDA
jgi:hypothetical protein